MVAEIGQDEAVEGHRPPLADGRRRDQSGTFVMPDLIRHPSSFAAVKGGR
jgi:hypothetical protein